MDFEDYIPDALEMVSSWEIEPEEDFSQVVNDQAKLMAGLNLEPAVDSCLNSPYAQLVF